MDSFVCRNATVLLIALAWVAPVWGQNAPAIDWRRIGSPVSDLSLASYAGGPVARVWYSADGSRLYARTASGQVWQTHDFESWEQAARAEAPERSSTPTGPDGALAVAPATLATRMYAAGKFAYRSEDGGLNWTNVTSVDGRSILGGVLNDLSVSPRNPEELVVAGANGVWRSLDGGESWNGLNDALPNLGAQRILSTPGDGTALHIVAGGRELVWQPGERTAWRVARDTLTAQERQRIAAASAALGTDITAVAASGDILYAGNSEGSLYFSRDRGVNWGASGIVVAAARIERIQIDSKDPNVAVAITRSRTRARVLRTNTGGVFWEDLTGNLPAPAISGGVAFDRASNAVYVATDIGLFFTYADSGASGWTLLRPGAVTDVGLDANGNQLYIATESGIYGTLAPHRFRDPRVVSAADRMERAAAPGSLLSVLGARVQTAMIGERNAPVLAATETESQIQVPFDASGSSLRLAATTPSGSRQIGLTLLPASPSIFVDRDGVPLVMNAESGLLLDPSAPARSGARLQILATGLGRVEPEWPTGLAGPLENAPRVTTPVRAYLEREPVEVTRATLAPGYIGMYLVEVQLPSIVNRGTAELYIEAQNQQSNRIRIYLEP
jgi:uncharacterized protein (TIGR03437 family)